MKEELQDRVDALIKLAKAGDGTSQLKLAKCFYNGHLVEKSTENALYWSFKAVSAGVPDAERYYNAISSGAKLPISKKTREYMGIIGNLEIVPIWEFIIGIFGLVVFSKVDGLCEFLIWLLLTGLSSGILAYIIKKVYCLFAKDKEIDLSGIITILIVHIISIYLGISFLIG